MRPNIDTLSVWLDNGDNTYNPASDTNLGSVPVTGANGGTGTVTLSTSQLISNTGKIFFLSFDISSSADVSQVAAMSIFQNTDIAVVAPATVSGTFPISKHTRKLAYRWS